MLAETANASASAFAHDNVALLATISRNINDRAQWTWTPILRTQFCSSLDGATRLEQKKEGVTPHHVRN